MNAKKKTSARKDAAEEIRYADAMAELEQILEDLENDEIDVDELSTRVNRASTLIRLCRERLVHSRGEIEQVVADLEALESADEEGDLAEDEEQDGPF